MTLEQLERRVDDLERQLAELRRDSKPLRPLAGVDEMFGMFADDPEFDGRNAADFSRVSRLQIDKSRAGDWNPPIRKTLAVKSWQVSAQEIEN